MNSLKKLAQASCFYWRPASFLSRHLSVVVGMLIYLITAPLSFGAIAMTTEEKEDFTSTITWTVNIIEDNIVSAQFDRAIEACEIVTERFEKYELDEKEKEIIAKIKETQGRCFLSEEKKPRG